ncbi:MAG: dihydrofolate reductase [Rhizobiales bacterium]|mgnify:CR=1 FL=1|nr:dihydrofolate reductase [Hyphomicrobiales bacterium]
MRRIIAAAFLSLDGVMQAPGGPEEDPTGGFAFGGWVFPLGDEVTDAAIGETFGRPFDLLLGRRTYDIFAAHWPFIPADDPIAGPFNAVTKYVATHRPDSLVWENSEWLGPDAIARIAELKQTDGPDLLTQGSTDLLHQLLAAGLVDELRLLTFPVLLGRGKRLFDDATAPAALRLTGSKVSTTGVVVATYEPAGPVRTGSFQLPDPSPAELERRRALR